MSHLRDALFRFSELTARPAASEAARRYLDELKEVNKYVMNMILVQIKSALDCLYACFVGF